MAGAAGRIPFKINGVVAPQVRNIDVNANRKQEVMVHADGTKKRRAGQSRFEWNLTCTIYDDKQVILALIEEAEARGEVVFTYQLGTQEYILTDVGVSKEGASSDSDGTADLTLSGVAAERLRSR